MSDETSARLKLPMIQPGQAQKELYHNEALSLIDLLAQPAVTATGVNVPPADPAPGAAWIVGAAPTGAWSGQAGCIAGWSAGGWRFVDPIEGMTAWVIEAQQIARFSGDAWTIGLLRGKTLTLDGQQVVGARRPAIGDAAGGVVIDAEARTTITAILAALRQHGLIAS